jgi:hypothetical protein
MNVRPYRYPRRSKMKLRGRLWICWIQESFNTAAVHSPHQSYW